MSCCKLSRLETLSAALVQGASLELRLTPKPGLVDRADAGSHPDLSFELMERSIGYLADYLAELSLSLARGEPLARQKAIGMAAEQRMAHELGTNTHKGYVFLSGLMLIACAQAATLEPAALRRALSAAAARLLSLGGQPPSNGAQARERYRVGGIVDEARAGLPSVFEQAVPAYGMALRRFGSHRTASFMALARLMQTVEDTTTLHRAGRPGLQRVRLDGLELESRISGGRGHLGFLRECNAVYRRRNITMGGVADLLGVSLAYVAAFDARQHDCTGIRSSLPAQP